MNTKANPELIRVLMNQEQLPSDADPNSFTIRRFVLGPDGEIRGLIRDCDGNWQVVWRSRTSQGLN